MKCVPQCQRVNEDLSDGMHSLVSSVYSQWLRVGSAGQKQSSDARIAALKSWTNSSANICCNCPQDTVLSTVLMDGVRKAVQHRRCTMSHVIMSLSLQQQSWSLSEIKAEWVPEVHPLLRITHPLMVALLMKQPSNPYLFLLILYVIRKWVKWDNYIFTKLSVVQCDIKDVVWLLGIATKAKWSFWGAAWMQINHTKITSKRFISPINVRIMHWLMLHMHQRCACN